MSPTQSPQPNNNPAIAINPMALSVEECARMLSAAGGKKITAEQVQADLNAGAPIGANHKINLIHYAAWLNRQIEA